MINVKEKEIQSKNKKVISNVFIYSFLYIKLNKF